VCARSPTLSAFSRVGLIPVAIDPGEEKIAVPWFQSFVFCAHTCERGTKRMARVRAQRLRTKVAHGGGGGGHVVVGVVDGAKGNPYVESLRLSFFRFPRFVFIPRLAPRGRQESHIVCVPRDAAEAAIFLLQFAVAHVTPLFGQGSPYLGKIS